MDGHTHIAMEWKDQSPGPDCSTLPSFLTDPFPAEPLVEDYAGNGVFEGAGFERHGMSVAVGSPQEEGKPMSATPHFGQRSRSSSSLSERLEARAGFSVAKLSMPDNEYSGAQPPYLAIPPGNSPASLLESPVFHSNAMGMPCQPRGSYSCLVTPITTMILGLNLPQLKMVSVHFLSSLWT